MKKVCKMENCTKEHKSKGYCGTHYMRLLKYGDATIVNREQHGMNGTRIHKTWQNMKSRCYDKNNTSYQWYGGRGIEVCDKWRNSFQAFYDDMGDSYKDDLTIERIDYNGNYEPSNCTWIPRNHQNRNQRKSTAKLTRQKADEIRELYANNTLQAELAERYNVTKGAISQVVNNIIYRDYTEV